MKPVTLEMQAFGPYKDVQRLDFRELGTNRLFLIHGQTGAGKSTVLDAICYALYGETSGAERKGEQMRCESASAALATQVTLEFEIGARKYRIERAPTQSLAAARGDGTVVKQSKATLYDITGLPDGQLPVPRATKIGEVKEAIREIIGLDSAQFRQVVVLPQGQFRELLTASSDKREDILRQLFGTWRFEAVARILQDRAKSVCQQREDLVRDRVLRLDHVGASDDATLEALTAEAAAIVASAKAAVESAEKDSAVAADALRVARGARDAVAALKAAQEELDRLGKEQPTIDALKATVELATTAGKVTPAATAAAVARTQHDEIQGELVEGARRLSAAATALAGLEDALRRESAREGERTAADERLRELTRIGGGIAAWREADAKAVAAEVALRESEKALQDAKDGAAAASAALVDAQATCDSITAAAATLKDLRVGHDADRITLERLSKLVSAREECSRAESAHSTAAAAVTSAETRLRECHTAYEDIEARWRAGRAAVLADLLVDGEPCPVCGSCEHPVPATDVAAIDDADLDAARTRLDEARSSLDLARTAAATAQANHAALASQVETLAQPGDDAVDLDAVTDRVRVAAVHLAELEGVCGGATASSELIANAKEQEGRAREAVEQAQVAERACSKDAATARAHADTLGKDIPPELRSDDALASMIAEARAAHDALVRSLEQVKLQHAEAQRDHIAAEEAHKASEQSLKKAAAALDAAQKAFIAALATHGFADENAYASALLSDSEIDDARAVIDRHTLSVSETQGRIQEATKAAKAAPAPDLDSLELGAQVAAQAHTEALEYHSAVNQRLKDLAEARTLLDALDVRLADVDTEYSVVGRMADVANARGTGAKVTFQRWVLGTYLDDVLIAASRRLRVMSSGRYHLERQRDTGDRKRPSGLDIAVFDTHANRARPAITLSGGESFLAALALALGLAETVQEQAGATPLETVFIDEGFGSLDRDALDLAMNALMDLQGTGRLVGVISHVPEMRAMIDARLEVNAGKGGSTVRFVVP